jgi:hypothetical protein
MWDVEARGVVGNRTPNMNARKGVTVKIASFLRKPLKVISV